MLFMPLADSFPIAITKIGRKQNARTQNEQKEQKGLTEEIAALKKHGGNKQNEDWYGSERRGGIAAFPYYFSAAKVFYDLRLDLRFVW